MKFFIDTADIKEIEEAKSWGCLSGVTDLYRFFVSEKTIQVRAWREDGKWMPEKHRGVTWHGGVRGGIKKRRRPTPTPPKLIQSNPWAPLYPCLLLVISRTCRNLYQRLFPALLRRSSL